VAAQRTLPGADREMIEGQAASFMHLPDSELNATLARQEKLAKMIAGAAEEASKDAKKEEEAGKGKEEEAAAKPKEEEAAKGKEEEAAAKPKEEEAAKGKGKEEEAAAKPKEEEAAKAPEAKKEEAACKEEEAGKKGVIPPQFQKGEKKEEKDDKDEELPPFLKKKLASLEAEIATLKEAAKKGVSSINTNKTEMNISNASDECPKEEKKEEKAEEKKEEGEKKDEVTFGDAEEEGKDASGDALLSQIFSTVTASADKKGATSLSGMVKKEASSAVTDLDSILMEGTPPSINHLFQ
jgi:hypothetical protein